MEGNDLNGDDNPTFDIAGGEGGRGGGGGRMALAVLVGVIGVVVMVLWRLWGRGCRQLEMRTVVEAERDVLFRFLSDPHNLKIIHPYTTAILVTKEREEGGVTLKEFDWVEKVPFTVVSAVRMRSDPSTFTITLDIVPAGGIHEVQLQWRLMSNNSESSAVNEESRQTHQSTRSQESPPSTDDVRTIYPGTTDDQRRTTPSDSVDDKSASDVSPADGKAAIATSNSLDKESRITEFHYQIRMTGPFVFVFIKIIQSAGGKLMGKLRLHFKNLAK